MIEEIIYDYYLSKLGENGSIEMFDNEKKQMWDDTLNFEFTEFINNYYPKPSNLDSFPKYSLLIKIKFTLKKPYTSSDRTLYMKEQSLIRDKFSHFPVIEPTTWKGNLRFAAVRCEENEDVKQKIIRRLFGSETGNNPFKGRLYFYPTFFKRENINEDIITPLNRTTRTPIKKSPIRFEVIKADCEGEFYLLYLPYPRDTGFNKSEIREDLKFLVNTLKLMFFIYGFSAKKSSGFGTIKENLEGKFWIKLDESISSDIPEEGYSFTNLDTLEIQLIERVEK